MLRSVLFATSFLGALAAVSPAGAAVTTFATVTDTNSDFNWQYANGVGTLNTNNTSQGAAVSFSYANLTGLPSYLQGSLSAYELINNGAGIQTSTAGQYLGLTNNYYQPLDQQFTISFLLANPVGGKNNLLTVTIAPLNGNKPNIAGNGSVGNITVASDGGYYETFSSDFLNFSQGSVFASVLGFNSITPSLGLNSSSFLNNFTTNMVGTFSSDPVPTVIPEPGSLAALIGGMMALTVVRRRRAAAPVTAV